MGWNGAGSVIRTDGVRSGSDVHAQQKSASVKVRADLTDYELEDLATAIENALARDGQNAASANLPMGGFKHTGVATGSGAARSEYASGATVQDGALHDAGDTGGTSTAYTATLAPAITAYADKQLFRVKFNATCGATPTIAFNGLAAKKIYQLVGTTATQITTSEIPQNLVATLRYDAALDSASGGFWLLNPPLYTQYSKFTTDTTPDSNADLVPTADASASGPKAAAIARFATMGRGHIAGLTLSNNGSDATNDIDIAVGACRSSDNTADIVLASALTKQLDAGWAVGTNAGMRATGAAIANGTYHIFLIRRSDTGVVDVAADTSVTGANIATNTNAAYTQIRRIGSILRESGAIVAFSQLGDEFYRKASVLDVNATNPGTAAVLRTLSIPTGLQLHAIFNANARNTAALVGFSVLFSSPDQNDEAAANYGSATPLTNTSPTANAAACTSDSAGPQSRIRTNTSAQIRTRAAASDGSCTLTIATLGWVDRRGRDD